jgi:hypothetical protein
MGNDGQGRETVCLCSDFSDKTHPIERAYDTNLQEPMELPLSRWEPFGPTCRTHLLGMSVFDGVCTVTSAVMADGSDPPTLPILATKQLSTSHRFLMLWHHFALSS